MKKLFLSISFLLSLVVSFAQPPIVRSSNANTVYDTRLGALKNFIPPTYADTTEANLSGNIGLDSVGALIFTFNTNSYWYRADNPKRWVPVGITNVTTENSNTILFNGFGTESDPLIANVLVSSQADNIVQVLSDGIYVKNQLQNGVIRGGLRTWVSGYTYDVTEVLYVIKGVPYLAPETQITLANADPTLDRLDLIVANDDNTITVITGTPAVDPAVPSYDPETQVSLGFVLVTANTTEPTPTPEQENIYINNTEWTTSSSTPRINAASVNNPFSPALVIEFTDARNNDSITFTDPSPPADMDNFQFLTFKIRSKAAWPATARIELRFYYQGAAVGVPLSMGNGHFGFNSSNTTGYQTLTIQKEIFGNLANVDLLFLTVRTQGGQTIGAYVDDIKLQGGTGTGTPITGNFWTVGGNLLSSPLIGGTLDNNYVQLIANNLSHTQLMTNGSTWMQGTNPRISLFLGSFSTADYYIGRNGTDIITQSAGSITNKISGNNIYTYNNTDGHLWYAAAGTSRMSLTTTGSFRLHAYGDGTFTGTASRWAAFDTDGNVIEVAAPVSSITANNGLTTSSATNVQLGGNPLITNTTIPTSAFSLTINSSHATNSLRINNSSSGHGIWSVATTGIGVFGQSSSMGNAGIHGTSNNSEGFGGVFENSSTDGVGLMSSSIEGIPIRTQIVPNSGNSVYPSVELTAINFSPANGFGNSIVFKASTDIPGPGALESNSIISKWTDISNGTRTSQFIITGVNVATTGDIFTLDGDGGTRLNTYGDGVHTGTATYLVGTDVDGNLIEVALGGGSMTNPMTTEGDMIFASDGSGTPARLPIGAPGEVLAVNGAGDGYEFIAAGSVGTVTNVTGTANQIAVATGTTTPVISLVSGGTLPGAWNLGTVASATLTNAIGLPISTGVAGLGSNVATALAINVGSSGAFVTFNGAAGTPASINLSNATNLSLTTGITGILDETNGGTGLSSYTTGDILYASGVNTLSKRAAGTNGYVLTMSGGVPTWQPATSGGTVFLVQGVLNRTTVINGSTNPTIDISANYVGQTSITVLGNVTTGTWNGTTIALNKGGTGLTSGGTALQQLRMNSGATALEYFTPFNSTWQTLTDGATVNWNVNNGGNAQWTLSGTGRTLNILNPQDGHTYTLRIIQGSGGLKTVSAWPTGSKWPNGGVAIDLSDAAGAYDMVSFKWQASTSSFYVAYGNNYQ